MRRNLIVVAAALILLACSGVLLAQVASSAANDQTKQDPIHQRLQFLTKALNLTSEQQQQVESVMVKGHQAAEAAHQNHADRPEQRRVKMDDIRTQTQEKIKALLTPEQKQTYEQILNGTYKSDRTKPGETAPPQQ